MTRYGPEKRKKDEPMSRIKDDVLVHRTRHTQIAYYRTVHARILALCLWPFREVGTF